jgi:putative intracellular protease/amidase
MSANIDVLDPEKRKRVLLVAANPSVSKQTGWPIGFWAAELTHPYFEFTEKGYEVEIVSPEGGKLELDGFSDPRHESGYSAHDLISWGFLSSPNHSKLIENTKSISQVNIQDYEALFLAGGQSPMYTFIDNTKLHKFVSDFYEAGKVVAIVCHATCVLLKVKSKVGKLLVDGKTWTGFANSEEQFADNFVGMKIQPFWIEEEARKIPSTNFIVNAMFKPFAVRDGRLITGQQQYSGGVTAKLVIEALGV